jgi:hypothetical protein
VCLSINNAADSMQFPNRLTGAKPAPSAAGCSALLAGRWPFNLTKNLAALRKIEQQLHPLRQFQLFQFAQLCR